MIGSPAKTDTVRAGCISYDKADELARQANGVETDLPSQVQTHLGLCCHCRSMLGAALKRAEQSN